MTEGWYSVEENSGRQRRWAKRRFGFRYAGSEAVQVKVLCCLPEELDLSGLRGALSGPGAETTRFEVGPGWNELFFTLPESQRAARDLTVKLSGSSTPARESRELALLVDSITVSPAPPSPGPERSLLERLTAWRGLRVRQESPDSAAEKLSREVLELREEVARLGALLGRASPLGEDPDLQARFEDNFRGSRELIKERQRPYLPYFRDSWNVLDVGCGRGEFLELLREIGSDGWGVEINPYLVAFCCKRGLRVIEDDALSHLRSLKDGSLDAVFCAQVLEHLSVTARGEILRQAHAKLKPAGVLVAETVNPNCLSVFSDSFYMDPTHVVPIPSDLLVFELKALKFNQVQVLFSSPVPEERRLPALPSPTGAEELAGALGRWRERLNGLLFGDRDYAVIARKPPG
ncbi:MAG TPA: class I SAM-dependent methyltransferase [Thermoanaerobaculia bacterium]|nr:class I SAM-dependent methyltransferase [Thermoanaerobaculia bacterium]